MSQYEKDGKTIYFLCNWQKHLNTITVNLSESSTVSVYYPDTGIIKELDTTDTCTVNIPAYEGVFVIVG